MAGVWPEGTAMAEKYTSLNFDPAGERIRLAHARLTAAYRREDEAVVPVVVDAGLGAFFDCVC